LFELFDGRLINVSLLSSFSWDFTVEE
jgi:hypothetical protein